MQKYADYIKRIEIDSLWSGKKHIVWELSPSTWSPKTHAGFATT